MYNKKQKVEEVAQGQIPPVAPVEVTLEKVKEWSKRDIGCAISFLNAIHQDPDLMDAVCTFIYGRFQNSKNAHVNQTKLDI